MLAVLISCVDDFQKSIDAKDKEGKQLLSQAEEWIMQNGSEYPDCFENTCEVLRFSPGYLHKEFFQWKKEKRPCGGKRPAA
jgi:hypothetical protein